MNATPAASNNDDGARQYFENLDEALRDFKISVANQTVVRKTLASLEFGRVYIPRKSRPYIALEDPNSGPVVAYVNPGSIDIHEPRGGYRRVELPTYRNGGVRSGVVRRNHDDEQRAACPSCYTELPASGVCGTCD
ncbi:MAG: hypothetical protein ACK4MD_05215 [Demequina sp.]